MPERYSFFPNIFMHVKISQYFVHFYSQFEKSKEIRLKSPFNKKSKYSENVIIVFVVHTKV